MRNINPYHFSSRDDADHKIEVKGNCTACGKTLGENDGLFLCAECQKKNEEKLNETICNY